MKIEICGQNELVKLATGEVVKVARLNNAATTPPFVSTMEKVEKFMSAYGAVHRGAGPFAGKTIEEYETAIATIKQFIGASPEHELIFTSNTTGGINLLAKMLAYTHENTVLTAELNIRLTTYLGDLQATLELLRLKQTLTEVLT